MDGHLHRQQEQQMLCRRRGPRGQELWSIACLIVNERLASQKMIEVAGSWSFCVGIQKEMEKLDE